MNPYLNISQIENALYGKVKGVVSDNVFVGNLPDVPKASWNDMICIDVVNVKDTSEYGRASGESIVNIFMYVRPNSAGKKNVKRFNQMEDAMSTIIEDDRDSHYIMSEMYNSQGFDKSYNFFYKIIALRIIIY